MTYILPFHDPGKRRGIREGRGSSYYGWRLRDHLDRPKPRAHFEGFPRTDLYLVLTVIAAWCVEIGIVRWLAPWVAEVVR